MTPDGPYPSEARALPTGDASGSVGDFTSRWREHSDTQFGFHLRFPEGWTIQADVHAILVQNEDRSALVIAAPFSSAAGETGATQIAKLPAAFPALLPQAQVVSIAPPSPANGDVLGELAYFSISGRGLARALCSTRPDGHGMLFVIAAPRDRFEIERPALVHILESLTFGPVVAPAAQPGGANAPTNPEAMAATVAAAGSKLSYVRWTDPREGAFHVDAPQGWAVNGGAFRFGLSDVRRVVNLQSPEGDITVQTGDAGLPLFSIPVPWMMQMGIREGQLTSPTGTFQTIVMRPMSARDFNRWYLTNFMGQAIDGIAFGQDHDLPDLARQQSAALNQSGVPATIEISETEFTGRSRQSGKPVRGEIHSAITHFPTGPMGGGIWAAAPSLCGCWSEGDSDAHMATAVAALTRLMQSWQDDPNWTARYNQLQQQILQQRSQTNQQISQQSHQMAMDNIRAAGERSRIIAGQSDDVRARIMGNFQPNNAAARDNTQRQFVNYVGDRTDVRDPDSGEAWNVGAGYNHYYRDASADTIIGTNSTDNPGVDFTQLHEF